MACSGNADAALQDEENCSARKGGQGFSLKVRQAAINTEMGGKGSTQSAMASQAYQRGLTPV